MATETRNNKTEAGTQQRRGKHPHDNGPCVDDGSMSTLSQAGAGLKESDLNALEKSLKLYFQSTKRYDSISESSILEATREDGTVVVPCNAKTMFPDHNEQTAYFEIPQDIKHGKELFCSHEGCRQEGVQFMYCLFCRIPVDGQSFWKKHHHESLSSKKSSSSLSSSRLPGNETSSAPKSGKAQAPQETNSESSTAGGNENAVSGSSADEKPRKVSPTSSHQAPSSQPASSSESVLSSSSRSSSYASSGNGSGRAESRAKPVPCETGENAGEKRQKKRREKRREHSSSSDDDRVEAKSLPSRKKVKRGQDFHSDRMFKWAVLFERRPGDDAPEKLSDWLVEVLKVSDFRNDNLMVYNSASPSFSEHDSTSAASSNATENPHSDYSSPNPNGNNHSESSTLETDVNGSSDANNSSAEDELSSKGSNSGEAPGEAARENSREAKRTTR